MSLHAYVDSQYGGCRVLSMYEEVATSRTARQLLSRFCNQPSEYVRAVEQMSFASEKQLEEFRSKSHFSREPVIGLSNRCQGSVRAGWRAVRMRFDIWGEDVLWLLDSNG